MSDTIRVFVGCSGNNEDVEAQAALHWSIDKHTSGPVEITWMKLSREMTPWFSDGKGKGAGWQTEGWATPFSALRWGIPYACGYQGKAIYVDVDKLVRADLRELWDTPNPGNRPMVAGGHQIPACVAVYHCQQAQRHLPQIEQIRAAGNYRNLRRHFEGGPNMTQPYEGNWNCLDMRRKGAGPGGAEYQDVDDPEIKLLHFTAIPTQPHIPMAIKRLAQTGQRHWYAGEPKPHPRQDAVALWFQYFEESQAHPSGKYRLENYIGQPFGNYGRNRFDADWDKAPATKAA